MAVEEVVVRLRADDILTQHHADLIHVEKTPYEKNQKLIDFVQKRGPRAFSCFLKCLKETGQLNIFDKLIEERKATTECENLRLLTPTGVCSSNSNLSSIQSSLRGIYSKSYRSVIPVSYAPFFFDIEEKWVNLTLKLGDSTVTEDYSDLLKRAFTKADMLIIEGDPAFPNLQMKPFNCFMLKLKKETYVHNLP
uniref:CARD domain-containing protein n=1 Tax=Plectus sambesii TaxID=2011161 RepID=A0A914UKH8_9BILA